MNLRRKAVIKLAAEQLLLLALTFMMLYPLLWMVAGSFKDNATIFTTAHSLLPNRLDFSSYAEGWKGFGGVTFATFFLNSTIITLLSTFGSVASSALIAYGFARIRFRWKKLWFVCMMLTMMLPFEIIMVPQYVMFNWFGWIDTYWPLILPTFFGTPFFIFLIMQFIRTLPHEMDEAAKIDGCGKFAIFSRIIVPLIVPAMMTCAIFSFYWRWDDFMGPLLYLNKPQLYPVSLGLKMFSDPDSITNWSALFAMSTLSVVPVFVVFFLFQRYIVEGISTSGLKG
ncbi:carbohydrate ABC transporter permease [Paenibacillus xanthanilyticus]|uniref:Carbohydrate ABC transporter permease n=1 Tax=Paenibacillus xanthanilyticus TaxID=1783531 RepID=A0ABV8K1T5_9BACL